MKEDFTKARSGDFRFQKYSLKLCDGILYKQHLAILIPFNNVKFHLKWKLDNEKHQSKETTRLVIILVEKMLDLLLPYFHPSCLPSFFVSLQVNQVAFLWRTSQTSQFNVYLCWILKWSSFLKAIASSPNEKAQFGQYININFMLAHFGLNYFKQTREERKDIKNAKW